MPDNLTPPRDERPDEQPTEPWALEQLLAADLDGSFELAAVLDALAAPAAPAELAGESAAVAAFGLVALSDVSATPTPTAGRARMLTTITASKLALAAAAAGIAVAGGVAAAYAGALPTTLQDAAHQTIGAPVADSSSTTAPDTETSTETADPTETDSPDQTDSSSSPTSTPVGPDANGPAAFGLCTAYTHGGLATTSVAYQALVKAAGGAGNIAAHCATIAHPGNRPTAHPTSHPTGSPTTHPTGKPTSHPTGSPTTHRH